MSKYYQNYINNQLNKTQIEYRERNFLHPSILTEEELLKAISAGDLKKASNILDNINKAVRANLSNSPINSLKNSLIATCTLFTRAAIRGNVIAEKAFTLSDTFIIEIDQTQDMEKLKQLEYMMLEHFIGLVNKAKNATYSQTINKAMFYIKNNLLYPLTLKDISDHCYVNASYLSHLFKKEVGVAVMQYINEQRIKEAKKMLVHTTNSISDIAFLLQYCNQSYFSTQFKLYENMTPRQFRNKYVRQH